MAHDDSATASHLWFPKTQPPLAGTRPGDWEQRDRNRLREDAAKLVYEVASSRVNSLPSAWSRALQFEQAIVNTNYPTRDSLLSELFGCFATVALWEMYGLKLTADRVSLRDYTSSRDEAVGPFARCLYGSRPNGENALYKLADGTNPWETLHILKVQELVIGFTSPVTLLCPAVHIPQPIRGMKWTANGHFSDPTSFLGPQQKQAFADWLKHAGREILKAPDLNHQSTAAALSTIFDQFIHQLTDGDTGNLILSDTYVSGLPPIPRAVSLLARPAKGGEKATSLATIQLGDRQQRKLPHTPSHPVILLDPDMPNRLGIPSTEIILYKAATLESVGADKRSLESLYGAEIEVITPDDIFLPELYLLRGDVLTNSWLPVKIEGKPIVNGTPVTPLLPLSERIRDLFSSEELCRQCTLGIVSSGGAMELKISLLLPLQGQQVPYQIARSYPIKEANVIDQDLPVIALWPYISDLSWKYYVIFAEDRSMGLTVDGFADYQLHTARDGGDAVKYFSCQRFPDLIKLTERNQYRGLIPVKSPSTSLNTSNTWQVGLDFGTSFTNFFINDGSGPERKTLETRVIPLTRVSEEYKLNFLYKFFIPETLLPKDSNPPTSTALNTYGWQEVRGTVPRLFHQARVQWPSSNADALTGSSVRTGFKWHHLQYQRPFLKELALLISSNAAYAGATCIEWAVSYPSAFSPNESRGYQRLWKDLCDDLSQITGLSQKFIIDASSSSLQTEAVAFASYFGNYHASQMVHTACLDVGGGTTDISIWQDNTLLHQVSIPFAGRDICTKVLQLKPSFIRFLFPPHLTSNIADNEAKLRQDPNFNSWVDNCLRYDSQDFLSERMPIHRGQDGNKQLESFVSLMAISFGGLYHYLGIILKCLSKEGRLRKQAPMPVYLGGNGARFMHWLDESGAFSKQCDADLLMEALQKLSIDVDSAARASAPTTLSDAFKDETACGLISKGINLQGNFDPRDDIMFAGEKMIINGLVFDSLERVILPTDMTTIEEFSLASLDELKKFVHNYDDAIANLRISTLLPIRKLFPLDTLWDEVDLQVRSICLEQLNRELSDLESIPGFIIGLCALIATLSKKWSESY